MYKKILSICLVLLIALSCFAVSVSAYTPSLESLCENAFINYLKNVGATYDEPLAYFNFIGDGNCLVFQAAAVHGEPVAPTDVIGNYRFTAQMCMGNCETNPAGVYAYNGGELMTLREAYEKGLVDLDLLYKNAGGNSAISPLSDEEILKNKCKAEFIEEFGIATKDEDEVYIGGAIKSANYTIFGAIVGPRPQLCVYQYIDGYWFFEGAICGDEKTNPIGMYTLDNYGNVQSLAETVNEGFLDLDDVFEELSEKCKMYLRGDIDGDKRLTVKDATLVQKYLAKVPEAMDIVNSHLLGYKVMDADLSTTFTEYYDFSADVNIKDATYIQKKVAKVIVEDDRPRFSYDHIIVSFDKKDVREYTLEDFPEYEFEKIKRWEALSFDCVTLTLYLKNPGKENVIDAVNSLKYREGTEFWTVHEDGLMYAD